MKKFEIDRIEFINKERSVLKIEGFFISESGEILYVKTQKQKIMVKQNQERPIEAKEFFSKKTKIGFLMYIYMEPEENKIEIVSSKTDKILLSVNSSEVKKSENPYEALLISIDSVKRIGRKKYQIDGWGITAVFPSKKIQIIPRNVENFHIERLNGSDVKEIFYTIKTDDKVRFRVTLSKNDGKKVELKFHDGENSREIELELPKFNSNSKIHKGLKYIKENGIVNFTKFVINKFINNRVSYERYINNEKKNRKKTNYNLEIKKFKITPRISFIMATYKSNERYLSECIESVLAQKYKNWELCIADDASPDNNLTRSIIEKYAKKDKRIKYVFREKNGHISEATNSALKLATGEYITMIDHDDVVASDALFEFVKILNNEDTKNAKLIYSDEDKMTKDGKRFGPYFKPDFSPDTFNSIMYIGHLSLYKKDILEKIGAFSSEYIGCQDYEMIRRFINEIDYSEIVHIPKILYHWRMAEGSLAESPDNKSYAFENAQKAIFNDLAKKGRNFNIEKGIFPGTYVVEYIPEKEDFISIIICLKDKVEYLKNLIESIKENTTYKNYELIIVDNNSEENETFKYLSKIKKEKNIKIIRIEEEFNFAKLNNRAVSYAKGDYLLFLNNDMELITPDWLERMLGFAQQSHIGAVGGKLLYEDDTIQHAGVILGFGNEGLAAHVWSGENKDHSGYYGSSMVPYNFSAVTAACLMISKIKFNLVNGFDEEYKVAYNDVDFCLKLREKGYYNVLVPQVKLYHYESKSRGIENTPEKLERYYGEIRRFRKKWDKYIKNDPFYNINLSLSVNMAYQPIIDRENEFKNKLYETVK